MDKKTRTPHFSPEIRERAVRMVQDHQSEYPSQWAALCSISAKIGCTAETLRLWMKRAERGGGAGSAATLGASGEMAERLKALERENRELRQANEILRKASAYFAQAELDRPFRR